MHLSALGVFGYDAWCWERWEVLNLWSAAAAAAAWRMASLATGSGWSTVDFLQRHDWKLGWLIMMITLFRQSNQLFWKAPQGKRILKPTLFLPPLCFIKGEVWIAAISKRVQNRNMFSIALKRKGACLNKYTIPWEMERWWSNTENCRNLRLRHSSWRLLPCYPRRGCRRSCPNCFCSCSGNP